MFSESLMKKIGLFAGGVLFGTAGVKILSGRDAKKVYTECTAAALRAKDCVMKTVTTVQENAEDILAEAQQINEERAAQEAAAVQETEEDGADPSDEGTTSPPMKFIIKHEIRGRLRIHVVQEENDMCGGGHSFLVPGQAGQYNRCESV